MSRKSSNMGTKENTEDLKTENLQPHFGEEKFRRERKQQ